MIEDSFEKINSYLEEKDAPKDVLFSSHWLRDYLKWREAECERWKKGYYEKPQISPHRFKLTREEGGGSPRNVRAVWGGLATGD